MAYGTVTTSINIQPSPDPVSSYIAALSWSPIPDELGSFEYTVLIDAADVPGNVVVSRPDAPAVQGEMYVRVYGKAGNIAGHLSNEYVHNYDFRPGPPVIGPPV